MTEPKKIDGKFEVNVEDLVWPWEDEPKELVFAEEEEEVEEAVEELKRAERLLRKAMDPGRVVDEILESIEKDWREQPRVPAGSSAGGQFGSGGGGGLSDAEEHSLKAWVAGAAFDIRRKEASGNLDENIQTFHRALDGSPKYEGMVYRGMTVNSDKLKEFVGLQKGAEIEYKASASASKDRNVSMRFTDPKGIFASGDKSVMFDIRSKQGADISSRNAEQAEVVLRMGSKYRVVKTTADSGGVDLVIHMEEV